jgi:ornithine cyclodeaminase
MIGAGHQSTFQLNAALKQREFEKVIAWNINPEHLQRLDNVAQEHGLPFESVDRETLGRQADVIITITSCHEPLLMRDWVTPGAHIACMGTDTRGKQEVDPALLASANVFTDEIAQSVTIGEAQHAIDQKLISAQDITPLGQVINGVHPGREDDRQITLFDGTGVGLQDLVVDLAAAAKAVELAIAAGTVQEIDL